MGRGKAFSLDRDFDLAEYVNVLRSTVVSCTPLAQRRIMSYQNEDVSSYACDE